MAENAIDQEVTPSATAPEGEGQDELDSILDALGKDDTVPADDKPAGSPEDKPYKVIGTHIFKTEADYDTWAISNDGKVKKLIGDLNAAKQAATNNPSPSTAADVNAIRMQIRVADFFEANPDAVAHKDVIAALLRSGSAKTLEEAKTQAFRAVGKEVEEKPANTDIKNIMKSGGGDNSVGSGSYNTGEDVKGTSDFADNALLRKI